MDADADWKSALLFGAAGPAVPPYRGLVSVGFVGSVGSVGKTYGIRGGNRGVKPLLQFGDGARRSPSTPMKKTRR